MEVKVLLDSVNPYTGTRLTTLHCVYPQFIHQQVLTHRWFSIEPKDEKDNYGGISTNSSSLRAISFNRAIDEFEIVYPTWTQEKKGMQGAVITDDYTCFKANEIVGEMYEAVAYGCAKLNDLGIHHQDINNYLRTYQNIHTVISSTDWNNFFEQRLHESTKPDMQMLAKLIYKTLEESEPEERHLHIPLIDDIWSEKRFDGKTCELVSAARLARISYFKWTDDPYKDLELAKKLLKDKHLSPFEHIAFAQSEAGYYANFKDWKQLRHSL